MYNLKRQELVNHKWGSMSVTDYEQCFVSLTSFEVDLRLPDSMLATMFEARMNPYIRWMASIQRLRKFKDVVEAILIIENNQTEVRRSHKIQSQLRA